MDISNVINLGLMFVTAIGVFVAAWQAVDARKSRDESGRARDEAFAHEASAARSASRSAEALERSAVIAEFALVETNRANRLEEEARVREGRAAFSSTVETYLSAWKPNWHLGVRVDHDRLATAIKRTAAGVSLDAESVGDWLVDELKGAVDQVVEDHRTWDSNAGEAMLNLLVAAARAELSRRLTAWVAAGVLDRSPLIPVAPVPPLFPAAAD